MFARVLNIKQMELSYIIKCWLLSRVPLFAAL